MAIAAPTRLDHVQALRGLAAMLVLLSHLVQIEARTSARPILSAQFEWGMMGVDLFFVISGFIMVYVTRGWIQGGGARTAEFLFARAARIYPLYWIISLAVLIVWLIRPDLVFSSSPNEPQLLNSVLLIPAYAYPMLEVGWTLVYEMMFYLLFAVILFLPKRLRVFGLIGWGAAVIGGNLLGASSLSALTFHLFNPLVLEFIAGALAALIFLRADGSRGTAWLLVGFGLIGLLFWFFSDVPFVDGWPRVLRLTLPAAALVLGAAWLGRHGVPAPRFTVKLGDWSYSLYLTHLLVLVAVGKIWTLIGWAEVPSLLLIIMLIVASILAADLTYQWIEKPLANLAKKGRRKWFPGDPFEQDKA